MVGGEDDTISCLPRRSSSFSALGEGGASASVRDSVFSCEDRASSCSVLFFPEAATPSTAASAFLKRSTLRVGATRRVGNVAHVTSAPPRRVVKRSARRRTQQPPVNTRASSMAIQEALVKTAAAGTRSAGQGTISGRLPR